MEIAVDSDTIISIHSTARVETITFGEKSNGNVYFNPLHREGGDEDDGVESAGLHISIHSTARVETRTEASHYLPSKNFNPLHREGGDIIIGISLVKIVISIHSTARVETVVGVGSAVSKHISIHSTARVETIPDVLLPQSGSYFNPLHREGGDH